MGSGGEETATCSSRGELKSAVHFTSPVAIHTSEGGREREERAQCT